MRVTEKSGTLLFPYYSRRGLYIIHKFNVVEMTVLRKSDSTQNMLQHQNQ